MCSGFVNRICVKHVFDLRLLNSSFLILFWRLIRSRFTLLISDIMILCEFDSKSVQPFEKVPNKKSRVLLKVNDERVDFKKLSIW